MEWHLTVGLRALTTLSTRKMTQISGTRPIVERILVLGRAFIIQELLEVTLASIIKHQRLKLAETKLELLQVMDTQRNIQWQPTLQDKWCV